MCSMDLFVLFGFVYLLVILRISILAFVSFFIGWKNEEAIERA